MKVKKIRLIIMLMLVFLVSGCSVEYNLVINEDSSINEEIIASEKTNRLESMTRLNGEQACNYLYNMFKRDSDTSGASCSEKNSITYGTVRAIYTDVDDLASKFKSDIFETVEVLKNDDEITITATQKEELGGDAGTTYIYNNIEVNITVPFEVVENNADSVSKNTYTWIIEEDEKVKTIKIVYKDKELPNRANIKISDNKYNLRYEYFIIGAIVAIILGIVVFVFIRSKKNNVL